MSGNDALFAVAVPQIKGFEGCRLEAYPDPLSGGEPWTIGYGCTGPGIGPGVTWTQAQADAALLGRLSVFCDQLDTRLPWWRSLSVPRQAVLLSMVYQMGLAGLLGFHDALADMEDGAYARAALDMLGSAWARQTPRRAGVLSTQMRTGVVAS